MLANCSFSRHLAYTENYMDIMKLILLMSSGKLSWQMMPWCYFIRLTESSILHELQMIWTSWAWVLYYEMSWQITPCCNLFYSCFVFRLQWVQKKSLWSPQVIWMPIVFVAYRICYISSSWVMWCFSIQLKYT